MLFLNPVYSPTVKSSVSGSYRSECCSKFHMDHLLKLSNIYHSNQIYQVELSFITFIAFTIEIFILILWMIWYNYRCWYDKLQHGSPPHTIQYQISKWGWELTDIHARNKKHCWKEFPYMNVYVGRCPWEIIFNMCMSPISRSPANKPFIT